MDRGFYHNGAGEIVFAGNRKPEDPAGLTWVSTSLQIPETLKDHDQYLYQWDGSEIINRVAEDLNVWLDVTVRPERGRRLIESDIYMISDYPITAEKKAELAAYRQDLRDLPVTLTEIVDPIPWPAQPA